MHVMPSGYALLLADLKARERAAQVKTAGSVSRELILLYWHIGLSIAARIVEKHGGALEFQTQPGRGTTFRLVLPVEKTA